MDMSSASGKTVLIVEDELFVRMIGADALEEAGYDVLEAESADEALKVLEAGKPIEVLFTDIRMPGSMDGLKLAGVVHERWPDVRILLTSGDVRPTRDEIPDDGGFLAKPYRFDSLSRELHRLLGD